MIELYTWDTPNGQKIPIMLEECELPYALHLVDISKGEQDHPAFRAINPNGKRPAIVDRLPEGDLTVFESGAILIYLAEHSAKLMPIEPAPRMACLSWLFWQIGGLGPMVGQWGFFSRQKDAQNLPALQRWANANGVVIAGYPGNDDFDAEVLRYCADGELSYGAGGDANYGADCVMGDGASGSGFVSNLDPETGERLTASTGTEQVAPIDPRWSALQQITDQDGEAQSRAAEKEES